MELETGASYTCDEELVRNLYESFSRQCAWYEELTALTQAAVGKLALSRGDITLITCELTRKQELIDSIMTERERIRYLTDTWQERKKRLSPLPQVRELDALFARIETAISSFLMQENHLKTFLQRGAKV